MLDERLQLAFQLFEPCRTGADIGTDHGFLPCELLEKHVCVGMLLTDISEKALGRARQEVRRRGLDARATLVCADGLDGLSEGIGCVSIMGMGGETIAGMLRRGRDRLMGATLVLSAHTDLDEVRRAVAEIGYRLVREELCRAGGRFYIVWRAEPGEASYSEEELLMGPLLMQSGSPLLREYMTWRRNVLQDKLAGLMAAARPDEAGIRRVQGMIEQYNRALEVTTC